MEAARGRAAAGRGVLCGRSPGAWHTFPPLGPVAVGAPCLRAAAGQASIQARLCDTVCWAKAVEAAARVVGIYTWALQ